MATVTPFIRTTKKAKDVNVRFRLSDGRNIQLFHTSEIKVQPEYWDSKGFGIKKRVLMKDEDKTQFNNQVAERKKIVLQVYQSANKAEVLTSDWLDTEIDKYLHPENYMADDPGHVFFDAFNEFLEKHNISDVRKSNYKVVVRALKRYELYVSITAGGEYQLSFDAITADTLHKLDEFLRKEHEISKEYPGIYEAVPESRTPQPRGQNTMSGIHSKLRAFILWSIKQGKTANNPYLKFSVPDEVYGTPYYISIEERNHLFKFDLSQRPQLAIQRDIFVFQCVIGCRVGDLMKMTKSNVIDGAIEYVPRKTKEGRPVTVCVPLNTIAKEILNRYADQQNNKLLPFISEQKYNDAIKDAFKLAELNRIVTVINPTTREEEKRPLNEIASSHLARRCFVGNLYKQVKDPNLVGALSGHKEGSKAFARYREIDKDMKTDLVKMLE